MMLPSPFRKRTGVLALAFAMLLAPAHAGWAQGASGNTTTIVNVAEARWNDGNVSGSVTSNQVIHEVSAPSVSIDTLRPAPIGGRPISFQPSRCGGSPLSLSNPGGGSAGGRADFSAAPTGEFRVGENVVFQIVAPRANLDPGLVDTITATLRATSGDVETLTVFETGPDTGVFIGEIGTVRIPPAFVSGDCRLSVGDGDRIEIGAATPGNPAEFITSIRNHPGRSVRFRLR